MRNDYGIYLDCDTCSESYIHVPTEDLPNTATAARDEARRRGWSIGKRVLCRYCVQRAKVQSARGSGRL